MELIVVCIDSKASHNDAKRFSVLVSGFGRIDVKIAVCGYTSVLDMVGYLCSLVIQQNLSGNLSTVVIWQTPKTSYVTNLQI